MRERGYVRTAFRLKASRSTFSIRPTDQTDPSAHDLDVPQGRVQIPDLYELSRSLCRSQCLPVATCMVEALFLRACFFSGGRELCDATIPRHLVNRKCIESTTVDDLDRDLICRML